jgi:hypothetical protein
MFEHRTDPLLNRRKFAHRMARTLLATVGLVGVSLLVGTIGASHFYGASWSEAFHSACLVLGQHDHERVFDSHGARVFAGLYLLYGRLLFVALIAMIVAPALHRMLHKLHLEESE